MFEKLKGGTEYKIPQAEGIVVNLPPKGYVYNQLSGELEKRPIYRRSPHAKNTYWEIPDRPKDFRDKVKKEARKQRVDPKYVDPELQAYRAQEWDRRLNGFWFYNNGVPTFVTGLHYFYLVHWEIDIGHPDFRTPDMEFFYMLDYCVNDPDCMGLVEVTGRRQGKTYRGGCFVYERITRTRRAHGGIQSKTLEDAQKVVFKNAVVLPWTRLPDFFRPVYDTGMGNLPKSALYFFPPSKKGKQLEDEIDSLESTIDYRSGDPISYDGTKLVAYFCDEAGKSEDIDVRERHSVVQFCFMNDENFIGKALYSTTVEDMESGGASFKELWDDSNQNDRNPNNRTASGMYRYFLPAYKTMYYDKYGFPDEERAKEFFLNEREALRDNKKMYLSYIRKKPFTIEEAFYLDGSVCLFDSMAINKQLEFLAATGDDELLIRGDLLWENDKKDGKVIFAKNRNGRFSFSKRIDPYKGPWNNVSQGMYKFPKNRDMFVIGVDPYDHHRTVNPKRRSDGAAYVFAKHNSMSEVSEEFVAEYINRPETPNEFFEDILKACVFFGCDVLPENNRPGIINYFRDRGYERFVIKPPGSNTPGINANKKTHNELVENTDNYIEANCDRIPFRNLLDDWLKLDITNTTKFDAGMAGGWTIIAAGRKQIMRDKEETKPERGLRDFFPRNF